MSRSVVTNAPKFGNDSSEFDYDELCENITIATSFREDPYICNKYIRCNHGYAQKFKCSKDTAWDIERKICLWVQHVNCGDRQLLSDEKMLGENDSDESMKRNGTRTTRSTTTTTKTTTTTTTTTTIKTLLFKNESSKLLNTIIKNKNTFNLLV